MPGVVGRLTIHEIIKMHHQDMVLFALCNGGLVKMIPYSGPHGFWTSLIFNTDKQCIFAIPDVFK